jgi:hypothetical protein
METQAAALETKLLNHYNKVIWGLDKFEEFLGM